LWQVCAQDCGLRRQRVPNSAPTPDRAALPAEELEEVEYAPTITLLTPSPGEVVLPAERSAGPTWKPTRTLTFSPQVVRGVVELSWEVLFFDMAQGFVQAEIDGETVETPLPFDPETGLPLGPDAERLRLDARFGSGQPLQDGPHQARLTLYSLLGLEIAATAANFSVNASPARDPPSLSPRGTEPVTRPPLCLPREVPRARAAVSRAQAEQVRSGEWPLRGGCGALRSISGFPAPGRFRARPILVYACPPNVCGSCPSRAPPLCFPLSAWLASHVLLQQSVAFLLSCRVFQHRVGVRAAEVPGGLRQGHA